MIERIRFAESSGLRITLFVMVSLIAREKSNIIGQYVHDLFILICDNQQTVHMSAYED